LGKQSKLQVNATEIKSKNLQKVAENDSILYDNQYFLSYLKFVRKRLDVRPAFFFCVRAFTD
jgi:hypothetical protein